MIFLATRFRTWRPRQLPLPSPHRLPPLEAASAPTDSFRYRPPRCRRRRRLGDIPAVFPFVLRTLLSAAKIQTAEFSIRRLLERAAKRRRRGLAAAAAAQGLLRCGGGELPRDYLSATDARPIFSFVEREHWDSRWLRKAWRMTAADCSARCDAACEGSPED